MDFFIFSPKDWGLHKAPMKFKIFQEGKYMYSHYDSYDSDYSESSGFGIKKSSAYTINHESTNNGWQQKVDALVRTRNIPYKEAKNILHEQQRREKQVERERQQKEQQAQYFEDHPDYKFNEIAMRWNETKGFIDYHENYDQDEENYIPFILEEANATLKQKWEKIDELKTRFYNPYKFDFQILKVDLNNHDGLGSHTFNAKVTSQLPEDMEGISLVALRIEVSGKPMIGASIVLATFDKNDLTKFTGRYSIDERTSAIQKGKFRQAYLLGSLITYQRMYVACKKNYKSFYKQIRSLNADRLINGFRDDLMTSDDYFQQLNQQQKSIAMNYINSSPGLYLLQGPPGTGKTTTICSILNYLYKKNIRTLVTAPSNKAVQVIAKKFLEEVKEQEPKQNIILIGVAGKTDLALEDVFLDNVVRNFPHKQQKKIKDNLSELKLLSIMEKIQETDQMYDLCLMSDLPIKDGLKAPEINKVYLKKKGDELRYVILSHEKKIVRGKLDISIEGVLTEEILNTKKPDILDITLKRCHISRKVSSYLLDLIDVTIKCFNDLYSDNPSDRKQILDSFKDLWKILSSHDRGTIEEIYEQQYLSTKALVERKIITPLDSGKLEIKLLNSANIVFSTLSTSGRTYMISNNIYFDHLIIDEAAQSVIPEMFIPLHTNPKQCLIVGDPQQLPATIISLKNRKNYGEDFSLMHQMVKKGSYIEMLTTQYRMHPEIRQWPALKYYEDKLVDDESINARSSIISSSMRSWCKPWTFYNVYGQEKLWFSSFYNEKESTFIFNLVKKLNENNIYNNMINIITFYSAQKGQIEEEFKKNDRLYPKINTVDSFQGSENDVIIISFVRANLEARTGFLDSFRRLNVALTRSKHLLLMVGDRQTLENSDSQDLRDLIVDAEKREAIFSERYVKTQWNHNSVVSKPLLPGYSARQYQQYQPHHHHQQTTDSRQKFFNKKHALR